MIELLLIVEAAIALIMGGIVFLNSPYSRLHQSFALLSTFSAIWLVCNAFSIGGHSPSVLLFSGRLITPASLLTTYSLLVFLRQLIKLNHFSPKLFILLLLPNLTISLLAFNSWNTYLGSDDKLHVGKLYPFFVINLVINVALSLLLLYSKVPNSASPSLRSQLSFMRYGMALSVIPAALFGAVLPLFGISALSDASPLFAIVFLLLTALSIIRHNLFDIRLVVARSFAYIGLIITIAIIYAFIVEVIFTRLFGQGSLTRNEQVAYLLASLAIGFTFNPLKRFFDRWSQKIFYRDSYEPQLLLNELNKTLVKDIDLRSLLRSSSNVISENIKAEFVSFAIKAGRNPNLRFFSERNIEFGGEELKLLENSLHGGKKVISLSDMEETTSKPYQLLSSHSIMAIAKISTRSSHLGYIFLGNKKSGELYSKQDLLMIRLIADELAIAIQNSLRFEEIQHFNVTLQEKVDEATKQLRHANHRLKELDQTKDEFISMASHQLRTPLTTIKGYLSMVLEGDVGPVTKDEKQMIQQAFDSAERMVFLIADLLNVSRLQSGKFVIENKPTDLAKMVESEVKLLTDTAEHHKLKLTLKKPDKFPVLNLDETKIRQVIMNFLDNAIYYTPAGGSIEVELGLTDNTVSYTVADTGLGVPKAEQHHLFSKFYRAGNARKMRPDGTGLGLFMAKKVIVAQGGSIIFKSEEGKGSTFGFSFPRHKVEIKAKAPVKPAAEAVAA